MDTVVAEKTRPASSARPPGPDIVPDDQAWVDRAFLRIAAELVVEPPVAAARTDRARPRLRMPTRLAIAPRPHHLPCAVTGAAAGTGRLWGKRARAWVRARSPPRCVSIAEIVEAVEIAEGVVSAARNGVPGVTRTEMFGAVPGQNRQ